MSELKPSAEFDWGKVTWTAPYVPVSDDCSYCNQPIPEDSVPLRMWTEESWTVQFCDTCMAKYWGMVAVPMEEA